jgi:hypothetical protein
MNVLVHLQLDVAVEAFAFTVQRRLRRRMGVRKLRGRKGFEGRRDFASSSSAKRTMIIVSGASSLRLLSS